MGSVTEPRYCARGKRCKHYNPEEDRLFELGRYHKGDLCRKCEEDEENSLEDAPEEYRELFRTAQVLVNADTATENEVIPTLVFAAWIPKIRKFKARREELVEAGEGSQRWDDFSNSHLGLKVRRLEDGQVPVLRMSPIVVLPRQNKEAGFIEEITIDVHKLATAPGKVAGLYEAALKKWDIPTGWGCAHYSTDVIGRSLRITLRPNTSSAWAEHTRLSDKLSPWRFPRWEVVEGFYSILKNGLKEEIKLEKEKERQEETSEWCSKERAQLIAGCVHWYVDQTPSRSSDLLKTHLLDPCEDKFKFKKNPGKDIPKKSNTLESRIKRAEGMLEVAAYLAGKAFS